jgi:predicted AAA+ superfamily ATPase
MAKSNRERVGDVLDILKEALPPYILRAYRNVYRDKYLREMELALYSSSYSVSLPDEATAVNTLDVHAWFKLMGAQWKEVFGRTLEQRERNYVSELQEYRNRWAHQNPFNESDAYRCADTATRLLEAIGAPDHARKTDDIARAMQRLRYEEEAKKSQKAAPRLDDVPTTTSQGLKMWRVVVEPHPDVSQGRFQQAEFAADLAQVLQGRASEEYGDPHEFFRRTYLTEGLLDLLVTGVQRLTGKGGDPVVQLQTSFGGGKTHSMLALYHLFSGQVVISDIVGGERLQERVGIIDKILEAQRAVIVGTAFSATEPRRYRDATTHTLWGEIAYQLGGVKAYSMVETADLAGVSPGSDTLLKLFEDYGPALIIMDELVAFARNLYGITDRLPAGSFDANMTFMQALTEAVKRSSDAMLLVSLPDSKTELGSEGGERAFESIAKTVGRLEAVWKPVTAVESFEIVRRRLFSSETLDHAARDAVIDAFAKMYQANKQDYPPHASEADYKQRLKDAYPIHPELFEQLYEKWSTLERFQRTRGVLRLMASVIHHLWMSHSPDLLIMPSSVPLYNRTVKDEILRYLPEGWSAVVDTDVSGDDSNPRKIDKENPSLNKYVAAQRVARAVFMGSAPNTAAQNVRGLEEVRVRLATIQPGEPLNVFVDALRRMSDNLSYLYRDDARYWYDTRPTLNRLAKDRAQNISREDVYREAVTRLKAVKFRRDDFSGAHVAPQSYADVADEARVRVVVLPPDYPHKKNGAPSPAQEAAKEILEARGGSPRLYRNMLVFIAADDTKTDALAESIRTYLAWKSIEDDSESLNLDAQQQKQVASSKARAEETLQARLQETYSWLIVPEQREPTESILYTAHRLSGEDSFYDRATKKLHQNELLIYRWSPDNLRAELDRYLWRDQDHVGIKQLWEYLARYCYLPRLLNENVLIRAVQDGVSRDDAPFAFATQQDLSGVYKGLVFGKGGQIYFDDRALVVRPEVAQAQLAASTGVQSTLPIAPASGSREGAPQPKEAAKKTFTRYHGTVELNPQRVNKELGTIVEEVIERLTSLTGTTVKITLEISAQRPEGFEDAIRRTISENGNTLKFKANGFDEE